MNMNPITRLPPTRKRHTSTQPRPTTTAPEGTGLDSALARREQVARQVARLSTIEDVRALSDQAAMDHRAGIINDQVLSRAIEVVRIATLELSATVVVHGCPTWCNAHHFVYGNAPDEDVSAHRHLIEGEGWLVELTESRGDEVGPAQLIDPCGLVVPLREARAYATALLAGCDAIEATRRPSAQRPDEPGR
jgi:hypothetical protein